MDPASDRSYHPSSDASLRSTFHHAGTPAAQRSSGSSRRGFSEVKSVASNYGDGRSHASSYVDNRSRHSDERSHAPHDDRGMADNSRRGSYHKDSQGGSKKSLDQHLSTRNDKGRSRKPYDLDIESLDKNGQAATWASRDWCAEARKSRQLLREEKTNNNNMGSVREDDVNAGESRSVHPGDNYHQGDRRGSGKQYNRPAEDARSYVEGGNPPPNRRQQMQSLMHSQQHPPSTDDFSCMWNEAAATAHRPPSPGNVPNANNRGGYDNGRGKGRGELDNRSAHGRGRPMPPQTNNPNNPNNRPPNNRQGSSRSVGGPQQQGEDYYRKISDGSQGSDYSERIRRMEERERASQNMPPSPGNHSQHGPGNNSPHGPGGHPSRGRPSRMSFHGAQRRDRSLANSINNGPPPPRGGDDDDHGSRGRGTDDGPGMHRARSKSRGSDKMRRPQQQQQPPQQQPRSRSRGPPADRSTADAPPPAAKSIAGRSSTPGGQRPRSRSQSLGRPTKRLGCLGGSSDMTRRRSSSKGRPSIERVDSGDIQANVESYQEEMKSRRRQDQTERMNRGLRSSQNSDTMGRSARGVEREGTSRGRSGRSQSRGPQGRGPSGRSRSRGPANDRPAHDGGNRAGRDPSMGRNAGRSKSRTRGKSVDKSLRRGKGGGTARASPDDPPQQPQQSPSLARKLKSKSPHPRNGDAATVDTRTTKSSKPSSSRGRSLPKKGKKGLSGKTVASAYSSSSSSTPETGPLSSYSGKSSKGSLLKMSSGKHRLGPNIPPSTPPQLDDEDGSRHSRPATPNRSACDDSTVGTGRSGRSSSGGPAGEEIATCMFDRKGYCVRHPHVRLRKKKMLGGWQVLIANCPDCCVEEMGRLKKVRKKLKKKKEKEAKQSGSAKKKGKEHGAARGRSAEQPLEARGANRGKSKDGRRGKSLSRMSNNSSGRGLGSSRGSRGNDAGPVFEFDIPIGDPQEDNRGGRSVKSRKSSKSARTNKSGKSTRTSKSAKSTRTSKSSKSSKSTKKGKSKENEVGETVVIRGSTPGSSQRFIRQGCNLRVAKMPFTDKYKREGKYTGEINEHGQPHGHGTLRYNNGLVYEGIWEDGHSPDMDANMGRAKGSGFSGNWKDNTQRSKRERERRKNEDMEDLRSFISQSVRSGATNASGSQLGSQCPSNAGNRRLSSRSPRGQRQPGGASKERVESMPWSDVNGFSGHYTGEVNQDNVPDGQGFMRYSNGVVEEGTFRNGVFQPPTGAPAPAFVNDGLGGGGGGGVPSSSMSVWSLKSSPTMAFQQGGHNVLTGTHPAGGASSVMGAPTSVHLGGPSMYDNLDNRF